RGMATGEEHLPRRDIGLHCSDSADLVHRVFDLLNSDLDALCRSPLAQTLGIQRLEAVALHDQFLDSPGFALGKYGIDGVIGTCTLNVGVDEVQVPGFDVLNADDDGG